MGAVEHDVAELDARQRADATALRTELAELRRQMGDMERAAHAPLGAGGGWAREEDTTVIMVSAKQQVPKEAVAAGIQELLDNAGAAPEWTKLEGDALGSRFTLRFMGERGLAERRARKTLGCMRLQAGKWRELVAKQVDGQLVALSLGPDKNRRRVAHEIALRRVKLALVESGQFAGPIFMDRADYSLSCRWKSFVRVSIAGPASEPQLEWNGVALRQLGLERRALEGPATRALAPEAQEWSL